MNENFWDKEVKPPSEYEIKKNAWMTEAKKLLENTYNNVTVHFMTDEELEEFARRVRQAEEDFKQRN